MNVLSLKQGMMPLYFTHGKTPVFRTHKTDMTNLIASSAATRLALLVCHLEIAQSAVRYSGQCPSVIDYATFADDRAACRAG